MSKIRVCSRCKCEVTFDKELVSDGYYCACLNHDEDLYKFETELIDENKIQN